jgi:hypothetical protein
VPSCWSSSSCLSSPPSWCTPFRAVKPKRIKFRAGFLKIVTVDFEADAGSQSSESDAIPPGDQPKELPPGRHHRR